ncbi:MAG: permease prefix domain 1-containing protein [Verrucomicrobiota bacterium]
MSTLDPEAALEEQIARWRSYLRRRQALQPVDVAELEDHLRESVAGLRVGGLSAEEAFLVGVRRLGGVDALSREFAREHSDRLWKQLLLTDAEAAGGDQTRGRKEAAVALGLAVGAGVAVKVPALFGLALADENAAFYARNAPLFVLPFLVLFFAWKRRLAPAALMWPAVAGGTAALLANLYPFRTTGDTLGLFALHLPIALWLGVGVAYAGGRWAQGNARMDFIRFSGELFIYYVLIALGGGVLIGSTAMTFKAIGLDAGPFIGNWLVPCGAAGAVVVASWLVEAKQSVVENMAPVLTRVFTPLFACVLLSFLVTLVATGRGVDQAREVLIGFDALLIIVLGLLLYAVSARDPQAPPGTFDVLQLVLVAGALLADGVALWAIAARIQEFGFTPNRLAGLGLNGVLLVNLAWSAVLYTRFLRGRGPFAALERWQTAYLPVYAVWAGLVAVVFPPLFGVR